MCAEEVMGAVGGEHVGGARSWGLWVWGSQSCAPAFEDTLWEWDCSIRITSEGRTRASRESYVKGLSW